MMQKKLSSSQLNEQNKQVTVSAGGVVVSPSRKVIVVSQNGNSWSLPKGIIEPGETEVEAAKREITEESGVKQLKHVKPLGEYSRYIIGKNPREDDKSVLKHIKMHLFTTPSQSQLVPEDPANPEARWVDIDQVEELLTHPADKQFFNSIKNRL